MDNRTCECDVDRYNPLCMAARYSHPEWLPEDERCSGNVRWEDLVKRSFGYSVFDKHIYNGVSTFTPVLIYLQT